MQSKKVAIILVLAIIAGLGVLWLVRRNIPQREGKESGQPSASIDYRAEQSAAAQKNIREQLRTDADLDGLADEEEKRIGTDPNLADSDGDGALDYDEVKRFQTDPKKKDTDGDGTGDAEEVRRSL